MINFLNYYCRKNNKMSIKQIIAPLKNLDIIVVLIVIWNLIIHIIKGAKK